MAIENKSKLFVSIPGNQFEDVHVGLIEKTTWSVRLEPDYYKKLSFLGVLVTRSTKDEQVKVDVDLHYLGQIHSGRLSFCEGDTTRIFDVKAIASAQDRLCGFLTVHDYSVETPDETATLSNLSYDLLSLWNRRDSFSDAVLKCGDVEFPVHKTIVCVRSPVFEAMFRTEMREGSGGVVNITDIGPDVLEAMLKYVYGGRTDHLTDTMAGDMLFAADKYQMSELKSVCIAKLKSSLNSNNVFGTLLLGHLHDKNLKDCAVQFICKCKNFSELESNDDWKCLKKEHATLAFEVLTSVVKFLQAGPESRKVCPECWSRCD